ncbi:MAG: carotenoid 1,2-hydratase [Acidobacteria bacterium]|nr:carotenoid 1,2-hydratase [Acidobacteriota bacterium]
MLGGGSAAGYERALEPRPFDFPSDHGPHPGFRNEWWYLTGNLEGRNGEAFGFQLTFFRIALAPPGAMPAGRSSKWATDQLYMAHFALSDVSGGTFHAFERFRRPALGLAGAHARPFAVWLDDWRLEGPKDGEEPWPLRLQAAEDGAGLDLSLTDVGGRVLQGDRGHSPKGPGIGNASFYYSYPRLEARGTVAAAGREVEVEGTAWLDREWSTSALGDGVVGWDWFSLQLDDGRSLMLYRLRRRDGSQDPWSDGTLVDADGSAHRIEMKKVRLQELDHWRADDGVRYPSRWRLSLPNEALELTVLPRLADQELRLTVRYWEGAVTVSGTSRGNPVAGAGYVELTGYSGRESPAETGG